MTNTMGIAYEIISRAPCRVSFAGGGTDIEPFPKLYGGAVVSATVDLMMEARLSFRNDGAVVIHTNRRPEPLVYDSVASVKFDGQLDFVKAIIRKLYKRTDGLELTLNSAVPMRSGLGGSAAMSVATIEAFNQLTGRKHLTRAEVAEVAFVIENEEVGNPSGRQDQYAAAFGGFNHFVFSGGSAVTVTPLVLDQHQRERLQSSMMLVWLDQRQENSGEIISGQQNSMRSGDGILPALRATVERVGAMKAAVLRGDLGGISSLLRGLWVEKKKFSSKITNPAIDDIYMQMRQAGAKAGKVCGAGGGGYLLLCFEPDKFTSLVRRAKDMGREIRLFTFYPAGVTATVETLKDAVEGAEG